MRTLRLGGECTAAVWAVLAWGVTCVPLLCGYRWFILYNKPLLPKFSQTNTQTRRKTWRRRDTRFCIDSPVAARKDDGDSPSTHTPACCKCSCITFVAPGPGEGVSLKSIVSRHMSQALTDFNPVPAVDRRSDTIRSGGRTDKILCRCFGAPATLRRRRVFA